MRVQVVVALGLALVIVAGCAQPSAQSPRARPTEEDVTSSATEDGPVTEHTTSSSPPSTSAPPTTTSTTGDQEDILPPPAAPNATVPADANPEVVQLRAAIRSAMASGNPVSVPAIHADTTFALFDADWGSSSTFQVDLRPGLALGNDTWAEVDGRPVAMPFVEAYEGTVHGQADQLVRLTLDWNWARGSIRVGNDEYLIRVGMSHNDVPGTGALRLGPGPARQASPPMALYDRNDSLDASSCPGGLYSWAPTVETPMTEQGRSGRTPITDRIILDADALLWQTLGKETMPVMVALANEVDSIYDYNVAVRHHIVGLHINTDKRYYPDPDVNDPLDEVAGYWDSRHVDDRDMVVLLTGYNSSFSEANCIGAAGCTAGYAFVAYPWDPAGTVFFTHAFAHELGHLFAAHHHYGNHAESRLATIMIQGYTPGAQPVFGTLEKSVIRGWAEQMLSKCS